MRSHKKAITRLVATGTVLGLGFGAAACSPGDTGGGSESLTVLSTFTKGTPRGDIFYDTVAAFTEETGIEVQLSDGDENTAQTYETQLLGGSAPDILAMNVVGPARGWVGEGSVVDVSGYIDDWGLADRFPDDALAAWTAEGGEIMGFPFIGFSEPVLYNMDMLESAGVTEVPQTVDELIAAAGALRGAGMQPFVIGGSDWTGATLFYGLVQSYLDEQGIKDLYAEGNYCDPDPLAGIEVFTQLRDNGVFIDGVEGYNADLMGTEYNNGGAAMTLLGSWGFSNIPEDVAAVTTATGLPIADGSGKDQTGVFLGLNDAGFWVSPSGAEKIDLVEKFITYLYDSDMASRFVTEGATFPAITVDPLPEVPNPVLAQTIPFLEGGVDQLVLPEAYAPLVVTSAFGTVTSAAFAPNSMNAQEICSQLEGLYSN